MRKVFLIFIMLTALISCHNRTENKIIKTTGILSIHDKLNGYFQAFRLKPSIEINNTEANQAEIQLGNQKLNGLILNMKQNYR